MYFHFDNHASKFYALLSKLSLKSALEIFTPISDHLRSALKLCPNKKGINDRSRKQNNDDKRSSYKYSQLKRGSIKTCSRGKQENEYDED